MIENLSQKEKIQKTPELILSRAMQLSKEQKIPLPDAIASLQQPQEEAQKQISSTVSNTLSARTHIERVVGLFPTFSDSATVKATKPQRFFDQIRVEDNGTTTRLWVYVLNNGWKNVTIS